jgi:hypothetical protein
MTMYAVLAPPVRAGSVGPDPDRFVFIKDGFCWPAFYLPIPWLIARRMWLVLVLYAPVMAAVIALAARLPQVVAWLVILLFAALVALEANNLRRWTLERCGYRFLGVASGERRDDAEYRFFLDWTPPQPQAAVEDRPTADVGGSRNAAEIVGLFPTTGAGP